MLSIIETFEIYLKLQLEIYNNVSLIIYDVQYVIKYK